MLQLGGEALVQTGKASPAVGAWTPNLVFAVVGVILFIATAKEISWTIPSIHKLFHRPAKKNEAAEP
jgi:hypothetical protein